MNKRNGLFLAQTAGILVSQGLDWASTVVGIRYGAAEVNGLMRVVMDRYGNDGFLAVKLSMGLLFAVALRKRPVAAWSVTIMFCVVTLWNLRVLYKLAELLPI